MMCQTILSLLLLSMAEGKKPDRRRTTSSYTTSSEPTGREESSLASEGEWPAEEMIAILGKTVDNKTILTNLDCRRSVGVLGRSGPDGDNLPPHTHDSEML